MHKGYIKFWRSMVESDMTMPDAWFKIWMYLLCKALHSDQPGFEAGELLITYDELRYGLTRGDGSQLSYATINQCLNALEKKTYIKFLRRERNKPMHLRICRWEEFQGEHPKGYDFDRNTAPLQ